jgi:beta-xylosidase
MARDMTLFVGDDGKAYDIFASEENRTMHISRLSEDYLHPVGQHARMTPNGDDEAPAMFKHGGKYYLSGPTRA